MKKLLIWILSLTSISAFANSGLICNDKEISSKEASNLIFSECYDSLREGSTDGNSFCFHGNIDEIVMMLDGLESTENEIESFPQSNKINNDTVGYNYLYSIDDYTEENAVTRCK
jgi:hypothetical protein